MKRCNGSMRGGKTAQLEKWAQEVADTGVHVLVIRANGYEYLKPSAKAVNDVLIMLEESWDIDVA